MLTGLINLNGKTCVFKLDKKSFNLEIEDIEDRENLPFSSLEFLFDKKSKKTFPKENILVAKDFERDQLIHFHTRFLKKVLPKTYTANVDSYVVFVGNETSFDGIQIQADELNWFYNIGQAFESYTYQETGEVQLEIKPYNQTTEEFQFNLNNEFIKGNLSIRRGIIHSSRRPLELSSNINYYFNKTENLSSAKKLVKLTEELLQFLSYRKNLHINNLVLTQKDIKDGKSFPIGQLFIKNYQSEVKEDEKLLRERIITYPLINSSFPKLLERLSEKTIYVKHIPETSKSNNTITAARIIMATAGFEWQIKYSHKDKSKESEDRYKRQKEEILDFLEEKIATNSGKEKKYFKDAKYFLIRSDTSLANKIEWAFNELDEVLSVFIKDAYTANGVKHEDFGYKKIAERIQTMRNNIAHGNIDKEDNEFVILDFFVLEWLYYAMVLDDIGISKTNGRKCINNLFKLGYSL